MEECNGKDSVLMEELISSRRSSDKHQYDEVPELQYMIKACVRDSMRMTHVDFFPENLGHMLISVHQVIY